MFFELLSCIVCSELSLNLYRCISFAFKLFSLHVHFELGLYFQCCFIISFPVFLRLVCAVVIKLYRVLHQPFLFINQVHLKKKFQLVIFIWWEYFSYQSSIFDKAYQFIRLFYCLKKYFVKSIFWPKKIKINTKYSQTIYSKVWMTFFLTESIKLTISVDWPKILL